jgi:O-acetyl-ADP-ribose deacetylase (regulator of RNase III)
MRIEIVQGDITEQRVDAIVNAANESLLGGRGVDGAIHRKGGPAILAACKAALRARDATHLPTGEALATVAGDLPARWVIHTVGPVFDPGEDLSEVLRGCYTRSLAVADERGARTVAFPLISAGAYGWPLEDAIRQALTALSMADTAVETATLVLFGDAAYAAARRAMSQ